LEVLQNVTEPTRSIIELEEDAIIMDGSLTNRRDAVYSIGEY